jgi:hypothetical protein
MEVEILGHCYHVKACGGCGDNMVYIGVYIKE